MHQFIGERFEDGNPEDRNGGDFSSSFKQHFGGAETPKEETKKPESKKPEPKKKEESKKAPKKREPKTTRIAGKQIDCLYYEGETLEFKDKDVSLNMAYNFMRSKDTNFVIEGKVKSIIIEGCTNCAVIVDTVVTAIELVNCDGLVV